MKAYIKSLNNFPTEDWMLCAYLGFRELGTDIIFFEDIEEVPANRNSLVVSYIEDTKLFLAKLGIEIPKPLHIPESLDTPYYLGRKTRRMTMKEFIEDTTLPVFVKPDSTVKEFYSGVITKMETKEHMKNNNPDTIVLTSEVLDFDSEWRGFVINHDLKAIHNYTGNFKIFPNTDFIEEAIHNYSNNGAPLGYSIDVGVTTKNETVLIECNDGWSLGSYGCNSTIYTRLLISRWRELMKY